MSIHSEVYQIPSTTSVNIEAQKWEALSDQKQNENEIDGMGFEAMKGEARYTSPEEASQEALNLIKKMKIGSRLFNVAKLMNGRSEKAA